MSEKETLFEIQHCDNVKCVRHLHLEAEFVLVTQGTLHILQIGKETVLHAGEALYIMPLEIHGFHTPDTSRCTILIFPADLVPEFSVAKNVALPFAPSAALTDTLTALNPNADYDRLHSRAVLYPLCCEISDSCSHTEHSTAAVPSLSRVERYIWENLDAPLSLSAVAASTGFNASYLSRMFRQNKGVSFVEYVNMLRCYQAVRLLGSAELSVSEIAFRVGFESIRTFNRVFRQCYGITPSEMKEQRLASIPEM